MKAIDLLKEIVKDSKGDFKRMNKSQVVGYLGELFVKGKLGKRKSDKIDHIGKRAAYDFLYRTNGEEIKIDVKTSTLKDEFKCGKEYWGWALLKSENNKVKCSHYICVALDRDIDVKKYYIISAADIKKFPTGIGEYKTKVKHAFIDFPGGKQDIKNLNKLDNRKRKIIETSQNLLCKNVVRKVKPQSNLVKVLKEIIAK